MPWRQAEKSRRMNAECRITRTRRSRANIAFVILHSSFIIYLRDIGRAALAQKLRGFSRVEIFVARFDGKEKLVRCRAREISRAENWMMRTRQSVEREHADDCRERGAEDGEFKRNRNERWRAVKWTAADVERVIDRERIPLHEIAADAAGQPAEQAAERYAIFAKADFVCESLDGKRRIGIELAIAARVRLARGV